MTLRSIWRPVGRLRGVVGLLAAVWCGVAAAQDERPPNVLLIMVDDLGFSDLGCYGGEIDTPRLDALATQGIRYRDFRVEPMCVVTRAALIGGMPYHQTGRGRMAHTTSLPAAMRRAGYVTHLIGKWHLGEEVPLGPRWFDRFYGFTGGQTNSFDPARMPAGYHDGRNPVTSFPADYYTTDAYTDRAMRWIQDAVERDEPFFTFLSYNAPHSPIHAPRALVEKYVPRYQVGWDVLRERRHARQVEMGLVDPAWGLSLAGVEARRWDELDAATRAVEAQRMAGYAGMVEAVDTNVGRLLDRLDALGVADDTLVIFVSDNGGDYGNGSRAGAARERPWDVTSLCFVSNGWGVLKNTPFFQYKHACSEGGLSSPMIVRWPNGVTLPGGTLVDTRVHVTDLYPTLLAFAGVEPDAVRDAGVDALHGMDVSASFGDASAPGRDEIYSSYAYSRSLVRGDFKAVSLHGGPWRLYDLRADRCETRDLAGARPGLVRELAGDWMAYAAGPGRMPEGWRRPVGEAQRGWGWHRLDPAIVSLSPGIAGQGVPRLPPLRVVFNASIRAHPGPGAAQLFAVSDPSTPLWSYDPQPGDWPDGTRELVFDDLPELEPDTTYVVTWPAGFVQVDGRPVRVLNDGAYWWRFRTAGE